MAPQEIRKHWLMRPFKPFRLHISDGSQYDVTEPMMMYVDLLSVSVGVDPDDSGLFRRSIYISPNHVSRIEPLNEQPTSGGNGRSG